MLLCNRQMTPILLACLFAVASGRISSKDSLQNAKSTASSLQPQRSLIIAQQRSSQWQRQFEVHNNQARTLQSGGDFDLCTAFESVDIVSASGLNCTCTTDSTTSLTTFACVMEDVQCQTIDGASYCSKATIDYVYSSMGWPVESKTCVIDYTVDNVSLDNFCTAISFCSMNSTMAMTNMSSSFQLLCGCSLTIGGTECNECSICEGGLGIQLDCTNVDQGATSNCSAYSDVPDMSTGGGFGSIFYPDFGGEGTPTNSSGDDWCTTLSDVATWVGVTCQCAEDNATDTATFSCSTTNETQCAGDSSWQLCADVSASVTFVSGEIRSIQSCADVNSPEDYEEMCVYASFCSDGTGDLCDVNVTYGGNPCTIDFCDGNQSFSINCSDTDPRAVVDSCQSSNAASLVSFVPLYQQQQTQTSTPSGPGTSFTMPPSPQPLTATTGAPTMSPPSAIPFPPPPTDVIPTASPTQLPDPASQTPTSNPNGQGNGGGGSSSYRAWNGRVVLGFATLVLVVAGL